MAQVVLGVLLAPLLIAVGLMLIREPLRLALPAYAALIPFGGRIAFGGSPYASLSSILGLILGIGLLLQLMSARRAAVQLSPTVPIWLLLLATAGATATWSIAPQATVGGFFILGSLVLVYVLISLSRADRQILRRTETALITGGVAAACYGVTQLLFLGGFPSDVPGVGPAPDGRFGNDLLGPDNQAVALLLPLVISLTRSHSARTSTARLAYTASAVLLLGGVLMTGSRGGILAAIVAGVALLFAAPRESRTRLLVYGAVGLVVAAIVWIYHPLGIANRTTETATSSSGRTDIWQVGLAACPQYCTVGSGWSTFPDVYAETQATVPGAKVLVGKGGSYQPHNVWLLIAVELGIPGLLLFGAGVATTFYEALRLPNSLRGPPMAGLLGTLFAAFFLSNLEFKFFWMAFIVVALSRNLVEAEREEEGSVTTGPATAQPSRFGPHGATADSIR